jgi:glycosyltransferase involved in cell wall biosynthesis
MLRRILRRMLKLSIPLFLPKFSNHKTPALSKNNEPVVNLVTAWNKRCGIFAYSVFLSAELRKDTTLRIVEIPNNHVLSPYFVVLGAKTARSHALVHVQFAYGIFSNLKIWKGKRLSAFSAVLFYVGLALGDSYVVTTFHELMSKERTGGSAGGALYSKILNKLIINVSDLIIVHTKENKKLMQTVYDVEESKLKIVPMGILENPTFSNKNESKRKLGLSDKRIIVIPGFISEHKGHDLIIKILPQIDKDVQLVIAGGTRTDEDISYRNELIVLAKQLNCADRITFKDDFPISSTVLNSADIALLPYASASESMALRLLVAYQIPTIASDLPVFLEIYQDYGCMELFKTNDTKDLLEKTQSLLSDETKRRRLMEKCRIMWSATKWSSISAKLVETYMEVFSAHPNTLYASERQKERLDWLKRSLLGNALEVGCATGYVTDYAGANVGLDLNIYRLRLAKKRYHDKDFVLSNAMYLPFTEKAFNTLLIPEILEHLPLELAEKTVLEAKRVGERILVTLPNADKVNYDKSLVEAPEHVWFPTKELIKKLIKDCEIDYTRENDFMLVSA